MNQDAVQIDPVKVPTVTRYLRVQTILEHEPVFKDQLGAKDERISKRNGQHLFFSKKVIQITEAIHRAGFDAQTVERGQVLRFAMGAFGMDHPNAAVVEVPTQKKAVRAKKQRKQRQTKSVKNGSHDLPQAVEPSNGEEKLAAAADITKVRLPDVSREAEEAEEPAEKPRFENQSIAYQVNTAIFTLLCAVLNLAERDAAPGADKRIQKVEALMDEYEKVKHHPCKSA